VAFSRRFAGLRLLVRNSIFNVTAKMEIASRSDAVLDINIVGSVTQPVASA
jgi:hypothetical protein